MPSQPRSPSFFENAGSTPDSQVSTCVRNVPAASSAARNSRTSPRTCSAASDRGAGASVNELLMRIPTSVWHCVPVGSTGCAATWPTEADGLEPRWTSVPVLLIGRTAGELAELGDDVAGDRTDRVQCPAHQSPHTRHVQPEPDAQCGPGVERAGLATPGVALGQVR